MYKCKECGNTNVEVKAWYNLKTEEASTEYLNNENDEDTWCCNCQEHTGIEWIDENVCEQCEQNPCICKDIYSPNAG